MILIVVSAVVFLDQLTKFFAQSNLILNQPVPVIKNFFYFTLVHNRGAAFGLLQNQVNIFILTALLAIILLYLDVRKHKTAGSYIYKFTIGLLLAGAFGNLIDRLYLGYVVDFLDFRVWPVFNVADSAITIGAILLGWSILKSQSHKVTKSHV